jgi:hypothetical protein
MNSTRKAKKAIRYRQPTPEFVAEFKRQTASKDGQMYVGPDLAWCWAYQEVLRAHGLKNDKAAAEAAFGRLRDEIGAYIEWLHSHAEAA